jgi:hypothetical protein
MQKVATVGRVTVRRNIVNVSRLESLAQIAVNVSIAEILKSAQAAHILEFFLHP